MLTPEMKIFPTLAKNSWKIDIELYRSAYFTWKVDFVSNIMSMIVGVRGWTSVLLRLWMIYFDHAYVERDGDFEIFYLLLLSGSLGQGRGWILGFFSIDFEWILEAEGFWVFLSITFKWIIGGGVLKFFIY